MDERTEKLQRILVASANSLFRGSVSHLMEKRHGSISEIREARSFSEVETLMTTWRPTTVLLDYDDVEIRREHFLDLFIESDNPMQVLLVSLRENGRVVVYDRRLLTPDQAEIWLDVDRRDLSKDFAKSPIQRSGNMKHFVIISFLVVAFTAGIYYLLQAIGLLPAQASSQAVIIDQLFNAHFLVISFLFSLIMVLVGYSLVVFRPKKGEEDQDGAHITGSTRLEVFWTVIPLAVVIYFAYLGSRSLAEINTVDPQALEVKVTAGQWYWSFEYPQYGVVSQSLNLPVDQQVVLKMTSRDVIHSFWVPEFRVKQDILPGENLVKELRLTPTELGDFQVLCSELCGGAHAAMVAPVKVMEGQAFQGWVSEKLSETLSDPVQRGEKLSTIKGCIGCHTVNGAKGVGPTWLGAYGSTIKLTDGTEIKVDDAYLLSSITNPNDQVHEGYLANVMPQTYADQLGDQEIADILAFMKSLAQ